MQPPRHALNQLRQVLGDVHPDGLQPPDLTQYCNPPCFCSLWASWYFLELQTFSVRLSQGCFPAIWWGWWRASLWTTCWQFWPVTQSPTWRRWIVLRIPMNSSSFSSNNLRYLAPLIIYPLFKNFRPALPLQLKQSQAITFFGCLTVFLVNFGSKMPDFRPPAAGFFLPKVKFKLTFIGKHHFLVLIDSTVLQELEPLLLHSLRQEGLAGHLSWWQIQLLQAYMLNVSDWHCSQLR